MSDFSNFRKEVLKVAKPRTSYISGSLGVKQAYKYYQKHRPKESKYVLKDSQYYKIIRGINELLIEELYNANIIKFPYRMGYIELKEYNPKVEFRDGKLHNTYYIDWNATLQLWFEDEYSKDNKILVRKRGDKIYRLLYLKGKKAKYNNKIFFKFRFHRSLRQKIKEQVINNNINAYKLNE
jgi:hypothetical protein